MDDTLAALSDAELESELLTLNAHLNAGEYRFLRLLSLAMERELWCGLGLRSCAHWLNWRFGIGMTAAREKVRVARALEQLPRVREAFRKGEVSYSKVRAIARVARPESEKYLLMICEHCTASHVERLVQAYRGVRTLEEQSLAMYARRCEWWHDEDRGLVIRARLPLAEGGLVVKALEAARAAIDQEARQAVHDEVEPASGHHHESDSAESPGAAEQSEADGEWTMVPGASYDDGVLPDDDDDDDSAESGWDEDSPPGVREDKRLDGYRPDRPDRPDRPVSDALRRIEHVHRRFGLRVGESLETRRADALVLMAETLLERGPAAREAGERHEIVVHVDADVLAEPQARAETDGCCTAEGRALAAETARRLGCDGALVRLLEGPDGAVLDVGRRTRAIPPAMRRALDARDGSCRFPGCTQSRWLDGHHIRHWANGGETKLSNLVLACRFHHRLLHEGGFTVEGDPSTPEGLVFRRPGGAVVPAAPWLTDVVPGDLAALVRGNLYRGADEPDYRIDAHTGRCRWDGLPMDMAMAVDGILQAHGELHV